MQPIKKLRIAIRVRYEHIRSHLTAVHTNEMYDTGVNRRMLTSIKVYFVTSDISVTTQLTASTTGRELCHTVVQHEEILWHEIRTIFYSKYRAGSLGVYGKCSPVNEVDSNSTSVKQSHQLHCP